MGIIGVGRSERSAKVPVNFFVLLRDDMNLVMAINLGADDFVAKPFRMEC